MTLDRARAFKLPDGRTLGETTPEDWYGHYQQQVAALEALQERWESMSSAERAHCEALCERAREFADAVEQVFRGK
jgi:hypothetical protein